jgi:hypothetical protein
MDRIRTSARQGDNGCLQGFELFYLNVTVLQLMDKSATAAIS